MPWLCVWLLAPPPPSAPPFGTGPNLLVWETGGYDFKDYVKVGLPFTVIFYVLGLLMIYLMYFVF